MIEAIDSKTSLPTISLLNTMIMFVLAWDEVADKTLQNCFKEAGFSEIIIIIISFFKVDFYVTLRLQKAN